MRKPARGWMMGGSYRLPQTRRITAAPTFNCSAGLSPAACGSAFQCWGRTFYGVDQCLLETLGKAGFPYRRQRTDEKKSKIDGSFVTRMRL